MRSPTLITSMPNLPCWFARIFKGLGLGRRLMEKLITYTRDHGLQRLNGITMPNNRGMVALARKLGFNVDIQLEEGIVGLTLNLAQREES
ncbi:N-acetyltransferase family protein [Escherichia coli]